MDSFGGASLRTNDLAPLLGLGAGRVDGIGYVVVVVLYILEVDGLTFARSICIGRWSDI